MDDGKSGTKNPTRLLVTSISLPPHPLTRCLQQIDPILQFLTRATGQDRIPLPMIFKAIPPSLFRDSNSKSTELEDDPTDDNMDQDDATRFLRNVQILCSLGLLARHRTTTTTTTTPTDDDDDDGTAVTTSSTHTMLLLSWDDATVSLGFPLPCTTTSTTISLHGSTKVAAQRRAAALNKILSSSQSSSSLLSASSLLLLPHPESVSTTMVHDDSRNVSHHHHRAAAAAAAVPPPEPITSASTDRRDTDDDDEGTTMISTTNEKERMMIPPDAYPALRRLLGFRIETAADDNTKHGPKSNMTTKQKKKQKQKQNPSSVGTTSTLDHATMSCILPRQASYAGSTAAQASKYGGLSDRIWGQIPMALLQALHIDIPGSSDTSPVPRRRLYTHQVAAIEATMNQIHCSVCTGTGSGKSLCYLLPALTAAYNDNQTSLLLFPTKALAQDQLSKLLAIVATDPELERRVRPATLDGDTSHTARTRIHECNIILTNPDILHASVLPSWNTQNYRQMLSSMRYIAIDEAHVYDGVFGAHVAMILRRLVRLVSVALATTANPIVATTGHLPTFIATSATLHNPREHFRSLCPIDRNATVKVISSIEDGSPRAAKHFFLWNPPVLRQDGTSTGQLHFPKPKSPAVPVTENKVDLSVADETGPPEALMHHSTVPDGKTKGRKRRRGDGAEVNDATTSEMASDVQSWTAASHATAHSRIIQEYRRRHAAEETARLLARAVANGIRCIAFCKTRNLVEWVYTKTIDALKQDPSTKSLVSKVESYRGGYTITERRKIEEKLFNNNILGVVGTNALELGVDIGGIDLTLHCGYPSSYTSLLQQAGRSGRGKDRLEIPSVAIVICFSSPSEQQLWKRPRSLLSKGPSSCTSIPFQEDLVQGHLLCASEEFPLMASNSVASIAGPLADQPLMSDSFLFGSLYDDALNSLISSGVVTEEILPCWHNPTATQKLWKARPSLRKAWSRLSIRSIEPIQYSIVDLSHSSQRGRSDGIYDVAAILDTIPYSRVFYHAHPGAIITHRGKKYEIVAMTQPPEFVKENFSYMRSQQLAAYVRPTTATYLTRPLADTIVTIVKQFENIEIEVSSKTEGFESPGNNNVNFAGCGAVSVKRQVRGYKKLSLVNFTEISRTELTLPPIEFDTFGLYICTDSNSLSGLLGERYGPGVHALSHALLAVAPLFAMGLTRGDIECCHEFYSPNKIILFDERAGGSGCVQRLWQSFFQANGILESAVDLLKTCSSCTSDSHYDGGCPACLHASQCSKFNTHLSRSAAIVIGERMIDRIKETVLYKGFNDRINYTDNASFDKNGLDTTPRREARQKAMRKAKEMQSSRDRQFVVARPSWPLDGQSKNLEHG